MTEWKNFVGEQYRKMKKINPSTKLGDAMKKASKLWKSMKRGVGVESKSSGKHYRKTRRMRKSRKGKRRGGAPLPLAPVDVKPDAAAAAAAM